VKQAGGQIPDAGFVDHGLPPSNTAAARMISLPTQLTVVRRVARGVVLILTKETRQ